jgi:8-oxo-dGTP pyrophosphatase MutT (NUDIX family)
MRSIVVQKAVITTKTGKILLLRRSKSDVRRPLQWDLPGGLLEKGEELITSIKRETKEEAGLEIEDMKLVFAKTEVRTWKDHEGDYTDSVTFLFYHAETTDDTIALSYEHDQFQWVSPEQVVEQFEYDLHKQAMTYILANNLLSNHE